MQVRAIETGFFGGSRIRPGQEFDVPEGTKASWFAPVAELKAADVAPKGKGKTKAPETLSELGKAPAAGPTDLA